MKKSNWREELNAPNAVKKYVLDEEPVSLGILGTAALGKWLLGLGIAGGIGSAAYDYDQKMKGKKGIFPDVTKIFNRGKTVDDIDGFWRDTSKAKKTDIPDGIGDDLKGQTFKPEVTKKNTEVGQVGDGTAVGGQTVAPTISNTRAISKAGAISQADVNKAKKTPFKSFRLGKPKIGTSHNVGRRVNPQ